MTVLLDTHALLWFVLNTPRLSATARNLIGDPETDIRISPASYWEIAIKIGSGKYELDRPYDNFMDRAIAGNKFTILPIEPRRTAILTTLPRHHGDPFDRLLIAQAMVEGIPILSIDARFDAYAVQRLWSSARVPEGVSVMRRFSPTIMLGHVGDARDWRALHEAGILAAVDLADNEPPTMLPRSLISLRFPLSDGGGNPRWLLAGAIAATVRLIRDRVPTLVFCSAGQSRTPCIVAAAWAIVGELDPDEALEVVTRDGPADVAPALWAEVRAVLRADSGHAWRSPGAKPGHRDMMGDAMG